MFIVIFFIILFSIQTTNHADISKLRAYPSGIVVKFSAPEFSPPAAPAKPPRWAWQRRKLEKEEAKRKAEAEANPPKMISYKRFLRIINATDLQENQYVSLDFYNANDEIILQQTITNSKKPTPRYIFYMDRVSGKKFKGYLDHYHIPTDAKYFKINFYNAEKSIIFTAEHPDFENKDKILISQYNNLSPKQKIMVQIELLGTYQKSLTRIGGFYFR